MKRQHNIQQASASMSSFIASEKGNSTKWQGCPTCPTLPRKQTEAGQCSPAGELSAGGLTNGGGKFILSFNNRVPKTLTRS